MERKGPRRESINAKPGSIEYMQNQIDAERKHGLLLPDNIETNSAKKTPFPKFSQFLEGKKPQDIILYSIKTGILRHLLTDKKKNGDASYIYQGDLYILSIEYKSSNGQTNILGLNTIPPYKEPEELDTGPYRKMEYIEDTSEEAMALKKMEEKINKADNTGIPLAENIKEGGMLPKFKLAIENDLAPEKIVLYSVATGILTHQETQQIAEGITYYLYINKGSPPIKLIISLNKNLDQACIISLSTTESNDPSKKEQEQKIEVRLELEDNLKPSNDFEALNNFFEVGTARKIKDFNPSDVIFHSDKFGILKFKESKPGNDYIKFYWSDAEGKNIIEAAHIPNTLDKRPFFIKSITKDGVKTEI